MVEKLEWSDEALRRSYDQLVSVSDVFREIVERVVTPELWVQFNELRDKRQALTEIAKVTREPISTVVALNSVRECLLKHDHDYPKVRDCINGIIDP